MPTDWPVGSNSVGLYFAILLITSFYQVPLANPLGFKDRMGRALYNWALNQSESAVKRRDSHADEPQQSVPLTCDVGPVDVWRYSGPCSERNRRNQRSR